MDIDVSSPRLPIGKPGRGWETGRLLTLIRSVLSGVGAVYLATGSVAITIVAAAVAVIVVALVLLTQR
ncbi:hypothetical protein AB0M91_19475 [Micromonospora rifamycinica]|uniref:hypothetical protein n=1 Tax=Micromonospora rifamycinica TaxID=291594 RepID=UPI0033D6BF3B